MIAAPRIDVSIALTATAISFAIGSLLGLLTGYFRGWAGETVMRIVDTVQAFPLFVLAIIVVVMTGRSIRNVIIVIALLNIPIFLRMMRSQVLSLRERTFVEAARSSGSRELSIAFGHVLPNGLSPGLAPGADHDGLRDSRDRRALVHRRRRAAAHSGMGCDDRHDAIVIGEWWTSVFPGIAISLTVFGFAVVGEGLRAMYLRQS